MLRFASRGPIWPVLHWQSTPNARWQRKKRIFAFIGHEHPRPENPRFLRCFSGRPVPAPEL